MAYRCQLNALIIFNVILYYCTVVLLYCTNDVASDTTNISIKHNDYLTRNYLARQNHRIRDDETCKNAGFKCDSPKNS